MEICEASAPFAEDNKLVPFFVSSAIACGVSQDGKTGMRIPVVHT